LFFYIYSTPFIPTRRLPNGIQEEIFEEAQSEKAGQEKGQAQGQKEAEVGAQKALTRFLLSQQ
jgi:hypothetical protein